MGLVSDYIKREALRINRLLDLLHNLNLVVITKEDLIRWRGVGYRQRIQFGQEGHDRVTELVSRNEPLLIARMGAVELSCLRFFLEKRGEKKKRYSRKIRSTMANNAGFFPVDDASLDAFAEMFLEHLSQVDAMGVWFNQFEDEICNNYCRNAELVDLDCLEPFRFANPWSSRLAGRKVLVVHPFVESIKKQYAEKRHLLFPSLKVLPDFELITVKAVQSIAGAKVDFATWFDAYHYMCDEIARVDFDICIIGAGAYGLPLAAFAKQLGKQSVHLGGVTQILFGIKGKRWERDPAYATTTAKLFNKHWVRPLDSETPANKDRIEKRVLLVAFTSLSRDVAHLHLLQSSDVTQKETYEDYRQNSFTPKILSTASTKRQLLNPGNYDHLPLRGFVPDLSAAEMEIRVQREAAFDT